MNGENHDLRILAPAKKYLAALPSREHAAALDEITALHAGDIPVRTKQLRGPIRELIVGYHRFTYFKIASALYFVRGFRKKSRKTPRSEIEYAEKIYTLLK